MNVDPSTVVTAGQLLLCPLTVADAAEMVVAERIGLHASDRIDDDGEVVWTSSP